MFRDREIRLSIRDRLSDIFTSPPSTTGSLSAFNVYYEKDYRDDTFIPVFPYVYILDSYLLPVATKLPLIVIELPRIDKVPFEVGNRSGRYVTANIHVFGKNRAERDDLSGFISDYFGKSFNIKTYTQASPSGAVVESALLQDRIRVTTQSISGPIQGRELVEFAGTVLDWNMIAFEFWTKL